AADRPRRTARAHPGRRHHLGGDARDAALDPGGALRRDHLGHGPEDHGHQGRGRGPLGGARPAGARRLRKAPGTRGILRGEGVRGGRVFLPARGHPRPLRPGEARAARGDAGAFLRDLRGRDRIPRGRRGGLKIGPAGTVQAFEPRRRENAMLVPSILRTLALLLLLGLALPAGAVEEATDELPDWMEAEADDAGFAIHEVGNYGADIPSPEEVVAQAHGARVMRANPPAAPSAAPEDAPDFEDFRHGLSPYGRWVQTPEYGLVWVPDASIQVAGWRPYLHGQWVWTRYGWTWVSDEPFGWATYHYGRWGFRVGLGWFWVPGYVWGPAWVVWRRGPDVIGWAPLYPGHVWVGVGYPVHVDHWVFVRHAHFHAHPIHRHWVHHHHHFHHTHWVRNWRSQGRVYAGPPRSWVERHAGRVHEVRIVRGARPAPSRVQVVDGSRRVEIYRPTPKAMVRPGSREATPVRVRTPLPADRVRPARGMRDERSGATPSVRVPKAQPGERVRPAESGS